MCFIIRRGVNGALEGPIPLPLSSCYLVGKEKHFRIHVVPHSPKKPNNKKGCHLICGKDG